MFNLWILYNIPSSGTRTSRHSFNKCFWNRINLHMFIKVLILNEKDQGHWFITEYETFAWTYLFIFVAPPTLQVLMYEKNVISPYYTFLTYLIPSFLLFILHFHFSSPKFYFFLHPSYLNIFSFSIIIIMKAFYIIMENFYLGKWP